MNEDLKRIKKLYGEKMAHLCRELFPSLLEEKGDLPRLLETYFAPNCQLCEDILLHNATVSFSSFLYKKARQEEDILAKTNKTPKELFAEVGYDFYECQTADEIQSFKKYYQKNEELCTFRCNREKTHHVFFAVKKQVETIKRSDNPRRQDEYGISVLSIQFTKTNPSFLSIKNRYNHTVPNPDSTFMNNLDLIIPGLTFAFENTYDISIKNRECQFELPHYHMGGDNKFYKYNYEINGIYYCVNNTILDNGKVIHFDPSKYLLFDYFLLDLQKDKKIFLYDENLTDSFSSHFVKSILVKKERKKKIITIYFESNSVPMIMLLDKENRIKELICNTFSQIQDDFCMYVQYIEKLNIDAVQFIGDNFFRMNKTLSEIKCSHLKQVGNYFLESNNSLTQFSANQLEIIGENSFTYNIILRKLDIQQIRYIGSYSFFFNNALTELSFLYLEKLGKSVFFNNISVDTITCNYRILGGLKFFQNNDHKSLRNLKKKIHYYQLKNSLECSLHDTLKLDR